LFTIVWPEGRGVLNEFLCQMRECDLRSIGFPHLGQGLPFPMMTACRNFIKKIRLRLVIRVTSRKRRHFVDSGLSCRRELTLSKMLQMSISGSRVTFRMSRPDCQTVFCVAKLNAVKGEKIA
jgi:hypothetical protein